MFVLKQISIFLMKIHDVNKFSYRGWKVDDGKTLQTETKNLQFENFKNNYKFKTKINIKKYIIMQR